MDENRIEGTVRNVGGKVQEGYGRVTGDTAAQAKGLANQAAGAAQDLYGKAKDASSESAASFDQWFRDTATSQPYVTAAVALGIGWLLGRLRQPY